MSKILLFLNSIEDAESPTLAETPGRPPVAAMLSQDRRVPYMVRTYANYSQGLYFRERNS